MKKGRSNPALDRIKSAAEKARQKAKESQARHAGFDYLKWDGKKLEAKDRTTTLLSVIPYVVKEKHHPDGVDPGELWYKRPFMVHRNIGGRRRGVWEDMWSVPRPSTPGLSAQFVMTRKLSGRLSGSAGRV
jgi:hypothetical protein